MPAPGIILKPLPYEKRYILWASVSFQIKGKLYSINAGFKTDGASIPRFAWITTGTPFAPRHIRAAVIHDFLYQTGHVSRKDADDYFKFILREDGVNDYQANKMYLALRAFGWVAWRRYRKGGKE